MTDISEKIARLRSNLANVDSTTATIGLGSVDQILEILDDLARAQSESKVHKVIATAVAYSTSITDVEQFGYPKDSEMADWHVEHLRKQSALIQAVNDFVGRKDNE